MSGPNPIPPALANGNSASARVPVNSAELVGSQFVSQFYTVLHTSPNFLYRFYTDESTVTHADGGTETEPPSSVTVATQRHISDRVQAMGFQEATTEIWSVDSQYSKDNGVIVLVTGSLQCKGKKKRDFVQSFFLAPQEKGYFVLNDTFRYLSVNHSRQGQGLKENGYHQAIYDKPYSQSAYHPQSYYPAPAQHQTPQQTSNSIYSSHPGAAAYSSSHPLSAASQQRADQARGHAVTPSILPSRTAPQPPKPVGPSSQTTQPQLPSASASTASASEVLPHPAAQSDAGQEPVTTAGLAPPTATAAIEKPKTDPASKPQATEAVAPPSEPVTQPKAMAKAEGKADRQAPLADKAPRKGIEAPAPAVPLTYADRLKLGSRSAAPKSAPGPVAPPAAAAPQPAPQKEAEPATEEPPAVEAAEASTTAVNGSVTPLPEEVLTTSIFVRSLPEGTTQEKLEEAFARFGNIKSVSLKQQPKGKGDFAFVEFEEVAAMQAAIQAKVIIDGKTVTVMERKPMISKHARAPFQGGGRGEGRGFRGGRDGRGRGGRGDGRPFTGGRTDRGEGREGPGGRGRSYSGTFSAEPRLDGPKPGFEGRGEGGRGRGEGRGRGRNTGRQPPAQSRPEQA